MTYTEFSRAVTRVVYALKERFGERATAKVKQAYMLVCASDYIHICMIYPSPFAYLYIYVGETSGSLMSQSCRSIGLSFCCFFSRDDLSPSKYSMGSS